MKLYSKNPETTYNIGKIIGENINNDATICLIGDIGVGKTVLIKGIASSLGINPDEVVSPYFNISFEYTNDKGRTILHHFDFMRLLSVNDLETLNMSEIFENDALVVIEWGGKFSEVLPDNALYIEIEDTSPTERVITFTTKETSIYNKLKDSLNTFPE